MKVLVTGGTGTISSGLVQESVNRDYETYAVTRGKNNHRNVVGAHYLYADLWNTEDMKKALDGLQLDVVVECLAYNVKQLKESLENFACRTNQYIFISTAGVYNRVGEKRIRESDPKDFTDWKYTKDKIECEKYLQAYAKKTGLKYTIVRPTVTYGDYRIPFPIATRTPGWTFFDRMQSGRLMLASDNVRFSIIHITDFSKKVVSLFGNAQAINEDFHITSDNSDIMWDDVIKQSGEILGIDPIIIHVPTKIIRKTWPEIYDEIAYHKNTTQIFNSEKIEKTTGVVSQISLKSGMQKTISAMHSEYYGNNLSLDEMWNRKCDAAILYAYRKHLLSEEDRKHVTEYCRTNGSRPLVQNLRFVRQNNVKKQVRCLVSKVKIMINRIMGR